MNKCIYIIPIILFAFGCKKERLNEGGQVQIPDFNYPETIVFEDSLSEYNVFQGTPESLTPSSEYEFLELSSPLFSDYAHKQRLVKIPTGTQMSNNSDGTVNFPDGTILTKTFYYYNDERDTSLGKDIIETRLLIKQSNIWNAATYIWNTTQTEAFLEKNGSSKSVSWIDIDGISHSTAFKIPSQNECIACHQSSSKLIPIGPTLLNLNRMVDRHGINQNQLTYLQAEGLMNTFDVTTAPHMVNYNDQSESLEDRGRSYLHINCAHCHNPNGWNIPAQRDFDFRYGTSLTNSGIPYGKDKITDAVSNGEMPFIGTTVLDQDGIDLINDYIESL